MKIGDKVYIDRRMSSYKKALAELVTLREKLLCT